MTVSEKRLTVLWDIDGTLMLTGGAGIHALRLTVQRLFGVSQYPELDYHGRTDYAIVRELFEKLELPFDRHFHDFRRQYHLQLAESLRTNRGGLLPGVSELLRQMREDARYSLGLLTGNSREAAGLKLAAYDVAHYFDYGGYGDHHLKRDDVARDARLAAFTNLGHEFHPEQVVVIGDTPADISCARAIGARVIAVATGSTSLEQLQDCRPDLAVRTLQEVDVASLL